MTSRNLLAVALLTALMGCKAAESPSAPAPAAQAPAATPTPAQAKPAEPVPTAAAPAEANDGKSLCATGDDIVLSCTVGADKQMISLCASKGVSDQSGSVYFAQGAGGKAEYLFPADKSAPARRFKRTQLGFAGNTGGYAYSFEDGGRKRVFYSVSGERGLEEQGLLIVAGDALKAESSLACEQGSVLRNEDNALFKFTRSWDRDEQIDQHGLPSKN